MLGSTLGALSQLSGADLEGSVAASPLSPDGTTEQSLTTTGVLAKEPDVLESSVASSALSEIGAARAPAASAPADLRSRCDGCMP